MNEDGLQTRTGSCERSPWQEFQLAEDEQWSEDAQGNELSHQRVFGWLCWFFSCVMKRCMVSIYAVFMLKTSCRKVVTNLLRAIYCVFVCWRYKCWKNIGSFDRCIYNSQPVQTLPALRPSCRLLPIRTVIIEPCCHFSFNSAQAWNKVHTNLQMAYGADLTLNTFIAVTAINIQLLWYAFTMIPQMFDILSVFAGCNLHIFGKFWLRLRLHFNNVKYLPLTAMHFQNFNQLTLIQSLKKKFF